jgi:hypothetical protein
MSLLAHCISDNSSWTLFHCSGFNLLAKIPIYSTYSGMQVPLSISIHLNNKIKIDTNWHWLTQPESPPLGL